LRLPFLLHHFGEAMDHNIQETANAQAEQPGDGRQAAQ
jgi:hypothetical protein